MLARAFADRTLVPTIRVVIELFRVSFSLSEQLFAIVLPCALDAQLQDNSVVVAQSTFRLARSSLLDPFHPGQSLWIGLQWYQSQALR